MQNLTSENVKIRTEINIKKARYLECHGNVEFFRFSWEYHFLRKIFSSDRSACNKLLEYDRKQHPCLRLQNFVSILTYKNYLSFILKKDRRLIPTPLILPVPWLDFTLHGSLCATKNMAGKSV